jgi:ketopantoate hydroxymethyltransferase
MSDRSEIDVLHRRVDLLEDNVTRWELASELATIKVTTVDVASADRATDAAVDPVVIASSVGVQVREYTSLFLISIVNSIILPFGTA